jgi:glycosyltransferase involved in cell wall biosynthesis
LVIALDILRTKTPKDVEIILVVNGEWDDDRYGVLAHAQAIAKQDQRVKVVNRCPSSGFASSANAGLREATGKYLVVIHDDVLVTKGWLEGLRAAMRAGESLTGAKIGFIGPVTNAGATRQNLAHRYAGQLPMHDPNRAEDVAEALRTSSNEDVSVAGVLDSFCLMMTRPAYEATGGFDEAFDPAGFEDVDIVLRGQSNGYLSCIATRVFAYHAYESTLRMSITKRYGDMPNEEAFLRKHWKPSVRRTLCVGMLASLDTEADEVMFTEQLAQMAPIADAIVVVDLASKRSVQTAAESAGVWAKTTCIRMASTVPVTGTIIKNALLKAMQETRTDWCFVLERGQFLSAKVTRGSFDQLMCPIDPTTKAYRYPVRTYWRGTQFFRVDSPFGERFDQQLFKNEAWGVFSGSKGLDELSTPPGIPAENVAYTAKLVLLDHTFVDMEGLGQRKLSVNEHPHLLVPAQHPTLSYLVMVKNEETEMLRVLKCYHEWADELVIVDTGSTDRTVELCELFGVTPKRYACCDKSNDASHALCSYGEARNACIEQCTGDYILFMDADEAISNKDYAYIPDLLLEGADGFLCSINNLMRMPGSPIMNYQTTQARLFRNRPEIRFEAAIHETLEEAFRKTPMALAKSDVVIDHYGYLRQTPEEKERKLERYAQLLIESLEKNPTDVRSLHALGQHLNSQHRYDDGDPLLAKALALDPQFFAARFDLVFRMLKRTQDLIASCPPASIPNETKRQVIDGISRSIRKWSDTYVENPE